MTAPLKLCKNGCNQPVVKNRRICKKCLQIQKKENWEKHKDKYNAQRKKPTRDAKCDRCGKPFTTSKDLRRFCNEDCKAKFNYEKRSIFYITRAKAINKIRDRGKKRVNGQHYTTEEINYIKKNYGKKDAVAIAEHLDRPVRGIYNKIRELKNNGEIIDLTHGL